VPVHRSVYGYDRQTWVETSETDIGQFSKSLTARSNWHNASVEVMEACFQSLGHIDAAIASARVATAKQNILGADVERGHNQLTDTKGCREEWVSAQR
jgi:hypothetical protein